MNGFRLICCQCGSDKIIEKSAKNKLECFGEQNIYCEGIERKCLDCSNEAFAIIRSGADQNR